MKLLRARCLESAVFALGLISMAGHLGATSLDTKSSGLFALEGYSSEESVEITNESHFYAVETAYSVSQHIDASVIDSTPPSLPNNVKVITPEDLGLSAEYTDPAFDDGSVFTAPSPNTGSLGMGIQGKIYAEYGSDEKIGSMVISFASTNALIDVTDYPDLIDGDLIKACEPVLVAAMEYARKRGLDGADFLVTGYRLGGGMAASMLKHSNEVAGNFFADAMYVSHDGPIAYGDRLYDSKGKENFFAYGNENDVVHRYTGEYETVRDVFSANDERGYPNQDLEFESSADNVVLFTDIYAELGEDFSVGILSLESWETHIIGTTPGTTDRIGQSAFYNSMSRDSAIVISLLSEQAQTKYWLEDIQPRDDKDYGRDAFLIGSDQDDNIRGSVGNDHIDGSAGHDVILTSDGLDTLYGGMGRDQFVLQSLDEAVDTVKDFTQDGENKDAINITDILSGYAIEANINDHVQVQDSGNEGAVVLVDGNGSIDGSQFVKALILENVDLKGFTAQDLLDNGNLIVDESFE